MKTDQDAWLDKTWVVKAIEMETFDNVYFKIQDHINNSWQQQQNKTFTFYLNIMLGKTVMSITGNRT